MTNTQRAVRETPLDPFKVARTYIQDEASDSKAQDLGIIARQYKDRLVGREARNIMVTKELLPGHDFKSSVSDRHLVSAIDLGACTDFNMACIPPTNPGWA